MTPGLVERHPLKEKRRANKPLLERKRRARINDSLADLKTLVLSSLNKDVSKYTKMEKVDILDMTVQFLKGKCFEKPIEDHMSVYRAGYTECTQQIYRSIMSMDGLDHTNKYKILSKISERLHPDERLMTPPPSPKSYCPKSTYPGGHTVPCIPPPSHFDRSPARPTFIDPTNTGHLPPKSGHLPPKNVHLPADIDCMKNLNKELRSPPYPLNNERLSPPNAEFRVSYSTRYEVLHKEQLVATSKLTRHSPYAKAMDAHLEKVAASLEEGSSSVWRPW